jgi:hypothetical protein
MCPSGRVSFPVHPIQRRAARAKVFAARQADSAAMLPDVVPTVRRLALGARKKATPPGVRPSWFGWRWVEKEAVAAYLARKGLLNGSGAYETVHSEAVALNPLPRNVGDAGELPSDPGWWGYSFRDVPTRTSGETFLATIQNARVVHFTDEVGRFWVGILNEDGRALDLREHHFREGHRRIMRSGRAPERMVRATWVLERVYHNYSHWLTAHLPKLLLLKDRDALGEVLIHPERPAFVDDSLRLAGIEPGSLRTFDPERTLEVEVLTVLGTDRFRPELLRSVRDTFPRITSRAPTRRIFISRARAARRRLVNEDAIWPKLERVGFERVRTEELPFREQVRLMQETAVLFAPHGAGLTNMMFCPPGTHVVEIADLGFPNPNFYAVAGAMGHPYWLVPGEALGEVHPLEKDLRAPEHLVDEVLAALELQAGPARALVRATGAGGPARGSGSTPAAPPPPAPSSTRAATARARP